jgi:hypothetical protein
VRASDHECIVIGDSFLAATSCHCSAWRTSQQTILLTLQNACMDGRAAIVPFQQNSKSVLMTLNGANFLNEYPIKYLLTVYCSVLHDISHAIQKYSNLSLDESQKSAPDRETDIIKLEERLLEVQTSIFVSCPAMSLL